MFLRRRWLVTGGLALTALLVATAALVSVNAMARQTVREEHTYPFTGSSLSIDAAIGDVRIVPGDAGSITVARRLTYGLRRPYVDEKIDGDTFRVTDRPCTADVAFQCEVRWLLQVPRDVDVDVSTLRGSVIVSGLNGKLRLVSETGDVRALAPTGRLVSLRSKTGDVTAQNVSGDQVVATTTKGAVSLTFRAPPSLVVARSETGPVGVMLPDQPESYRINAKSQDGSKTIALNTAKDDPDARRRIDIKSTTGDVSVFQSPEHGEGEPAD
jgi:DUF4097 and DUF4098 domain-containing protein YvlB